MVLYTWWRASRLQWKIVNLQIVQIIWGAIITGNSWIVRNTFTVLKFHLVKGPSWANYKSGKDAGYYAILKQYDTKMAAPVANCVVAQYIVITSRITGQIELSVEQTEEACIKDQQSTPAALGRGHQWPGQVCFNNIKGTKDLSNKYNLTGFRHLSSL